MINVVSIVEGDGEVQALPVLLRRLGQWLTPEVAVALDRPIKVRRDRFLRREEEFRRMLFLAEARAARTGLVLILLDADDDCPVELATDILSRARAVVPAVEIGVVCANREFEAWFLACASSLDGRRGLSISATDLPVMGDAVRGAKEWLSRRIVNGRYRETTDQPAFAAVMDLDMARQGSRSFRKLCSEWSRLVIASESN